ncbi:hypothetical protein C8Q78DRAFT_999246 [Trametes maxima]|nr:hypothetical protein C8Q78DRAFT_999246 [Trametes maxima]
MSSVPSTSRTRHPRPDAGPPPTQYNDANTRLASPLPAPRGRDRCQQDVATRAHSPFPPTVQERGLPRCGTCAVVDAISQPRDGVAASPARRASARPSLDSLDRRMDRSKGGRGAGLRRYNDRRFVALPPMHVLPLWSSSFPLRRSGMRLSRTLLPAGGLYLNVSVNGQNEGEVASWLFDGVSFQSGYAWMKNREGHTPCVVARELLSQCESDPKVLGEFRDPNTEWAPISCACNSVAYSLVYACTVYYLKQASTAITQGEFQGKLQCGSVFVMQAYPETIPPGVSIPAWAYLPMDASDQFDVSKAQQVASSKWPDATVPGSYVTPTPNPPTPSQSVNPLPTVHPGAPNSTSTIVVPQSMPPTASQSLHDTSTSSATQSAGHTDSVFTALRVSSSIRSLPGSSSSPGGGSSPSTNTLPDDSPSGVESALLTPSLMPASSVSSSSTPAPNAAAGHAKRSRSVAPIVCGVIGSLIAAVLAVAIALCIVRRRRRRRCEKEALIPGEWLTWRKPRADVPPSPLPAEREPSECSTIAVDVRFRFRAPLGTDCAAS